MAQYPLILASSSPRRREILTRLGVDHRVMVPDVDETRLAEEGPEAFVGRAAALKARAVSERIFEQEGASPWVLGADTIVVRDEEILGKPADVADARRMIATLSGGEHRVLTGFCITRRGAGEHVEVVTTRVWFKSLSDREIDGYARSGEGLDKAGAYGIQGLGCFLVERVEGNYENVVGLPACEVVEALARAGAYNLFSPEGGLS